MKKLEALANLAESFVIKYGEDYTPDFVQEFKPGDLLFSPDDKGYWIFIKYDYLRDSKDNKLYASVIPVAKDKDYYNSDEVAFYMDRQLYISGGWGGAAHIQLDPKKFELLLNKGEYNFYDWDTRFLSKKK